MLRSLPLAALTLLISSSSYASEWEELFTEENITVWQREVEGTSFVEFRGRGIVEEPASRVAAVIRNNERKTEWMHQCAANFAVEYKGPGHVIVYNRTASPFFLISDRDVVLDVKGTIVPEKKMLRIAFGNVVHTKVPPFDGVVRMPALHGFWELVEKGEKKTEVTYQVQADPGGALPAWLVNMVSKNIPLHTIGNLRKQTKKPGYEKDEAIVLGTYDWTGFECAKTETSSASITASR